MSPVSSVLEWPASAVALWGFLVQSMAFVLYYFYYVGTFFVIIWQSLPYHCRLPNEDLGRSNQRFRVRFRSNVMLPKRRFWKSEPTFPNVFPRKHVSTIRSPNRVLTPLKRASRETRSERLVRPSKIFVWDGKLSRKGWLVPQIFVWEV
jgi:hypothetical protein